MYKLKNFIFSVVWISLGFLLFNLNSFSQNKLRIDGQLALETGSISSAVVKIEKNGRSAGTASVASSGSFELDLDLNSEYIITVTQPGYITRKFKILTHVPAEAVEDGLNSEALPVYLTQQFDGGPSGNAIDATLKFNQALYSFDFDKAEFVSIALQKRKLDPIKAQADVAAKAKAAEEAKAKAEQMAKLQAEYEEQYRKAEEEERRKKAEEELNAKYNDFLSKGAKALADKNYEFAKNAYVEAGKLKPNESIPPTKIKEIESLLANETKYKTEIEKGDKAFAAKDYTTAKTAFTAASALKPNEVYPKEKIKAADEELAKAAKEKENKAKFDAAMAKGDKSMSGKDYAGAKSAFSEALQIIPADPTATQKLQDAENKYAEAEEQKRLEKERNDAFAAAMLNGDNALKAKNYTDAISAYRSALEVKPNESAPKTKIAEAEAAIKAEADKLAKEKEQQALFESLIVDADRMFGETKLNEAKNKYNEALKIKPGEAYPASQIAKIDKLIAEENEKKAQELALNNKYQAALTKGETALKAGKLSDAKTAFTEASTLKPNEETPKNKLAEIELLLLAEAEKKQKEAELKQEYDALIATAKNDFNAKNYAAAISSYQKAAVLMPNEAEPKLKIKEAEDALKAVQLAEASAKEKQAKYDAAILKGQQLFAANDYNAAKSAYSEAMQIKPEESEPKTKIAEIDGILKSMADAEKAKKDAEEQARKEAELKAQQEKDAALAAEKAKKDAEEQARKEAELKAQQEKDAALAAEKAKKDAEEQARKESELRAQQEKEAALAAEKAKKDAEEQARKEAELRAQQEKEAALAAEKAKKDAEEQARKQAELKAQQEKEAALAAEKVKQEEEERRRQAEEEARRLAEIEAQKQQEWAAAEAKRKEQDEARRQQSIESQKKFAEEEKARAEEAARKRKEMLELAKNKAKNPVMVPPKKRIYLFAYISGTQSSYGVVNMNDGSGNRVISESEYKSIANQYKDAIK